tara:strand:+ start:373 stop:1386 length:1014 start_codon:yes stop_codon:yes gene_type:complete
MTQFKCKECDQEYGSLRSLHAHIKKHDVLLGDYYVKHFQRKDKLTGELIPFKKYDQYFYTSFLNTSNMKKWCKAAPKEEVEAFVINSIKDKLTSKNIKAGPPALYLETSGLPDMEICKEIFGSYNAVCKKFGMLPMLAGQLPKEFDDDFSNKHILIDTREQRPLSFKNSELLKLDVGDYGVSGELYDYTFVDRKSYQDFGATVTGGYARFVKELERCKSLGCFLFIVIECDFDQIYWKNKSVYKKFNLGYVLHNMRDIQAKYSDCCQFVFSGSREESVKLIPKVLVLGQKLWKVDLQYFWNKKIKKNVLGNRNTETPQRVQGYKSGASRKRGVFGGN